MKVLQRLSLSILFFVAAGCGSERWNGYKAMLQGSGTSGKDLALTDPEALEGMRRTVRGSIVATNGSSSQMAGWVILASPVDQSGSRTAEIDNAGLFVLHELDLAKAWTLSLLSPDWIAHSVLTLPSDLTNTVHQFFRTRMVNLPPLRMDGAVLRFQHLQGITATNHLASDVNGDGIPDGMSAFGLVDMDTDLDGYVNTNDIDIDGDGVINVIDPDDDGDGIIDAFDGDADADLVSDQTSGYRDLVKNDAYVLRAGVSLARSGEASTSLGASGDIPTKMKFFLQVTSRQVASVVVLGAPALLNGAAIVQPDGNIVAWNRTLADDGQNGDGVPGDYIFSREIVLCCGRQVRDKEVLAIAAYDRQGRLLGEYPVGFSGGHMEAISTVFDATTRTVLMTGNPFGPVQDFIWYAKLRDAAGNLLYSSQGYPGSVRQLVLPANMGNTGETYSLSVVAGTPAPVFGGPLYSVESAEIAVTWE
jgi:hypothetical protein